MKSQHWNHALLKKLEINENIFPDVILNSWDIAGEIKNEIAEMTGLPKKLQVIRGGPDSQCCSLGVAAIETNILSNMSGTSTCLNRTVMNPMEDLRVGNYAHVIPNCWSAEVGLNTTGLSLRKIAKIIFSDLSESSMYDHINNCVLQSPVGSNDLLYFPYLTNGERDNQNVKGGFYNLSMMITKEDMIRAVMEGVAFAEKERADLLTTSGELFSCMRISGGGASSDLWSQIKADVMNIPVYALKNVDAAELGTSMIVSVGTRAFPNFSDAVSECTLHYDEFIPNNKNISIYEDMYQEFIRIENALSR
jgi:sugar (pentulose or hexulose) kinase